MKYHVVDQLSGSPACGRLEHLDETCCKAGHLYLVIQLVLSTVTVHLLLTTLLWYLIRSMQAAVLLITPGECFTLNL